MRFWVGWPLCLLCAACLSGRGEVAGGGASRDAGDALDGATGSPDGATGSPDAATGSPDAAIASPDAARPPGDAGRAPPDAARDDGRPGSAPDGSTDPCGGQACSGHGACVNPDGWAACECAEGYHAVELSCVADPGAPRLGELTVQEIWQAPDAGRMSESAYSSLSTFRGKTYYVWLDADRRPWITQLELATLRATSRRLDPDDAYQARDDGHHQFALAIDRNGTIHVAGDMHHYPASNDDHLPAKYRDGIIMYWVSDRAEDISSFTWVGNTAARAIPGYGFTYGSFFVDNQRELFYHARVRVHRGGHAPGEMGVGMYRYDAATRSWSALGDVPPSSPAGQYKAILWEDDGYAGTGGWYQGLLTHARFDHRNRLHFAAAINGDRSKDFATHVVYAYSDDGGLTFRRAGGEAIASLPMRAQPGPAQADIVDTAASWPAGFWLMATVFFDAGGTPAVTYTPNGTVAHFKHWDPDRGVWSSRVRSPTASFLREKHHSDPGGTLTFFSHVGADGRVARRLAFEGTERAWSTGYQFYRVDEERLRETGEILVSARRDDRSVLLRILF